MGLLHVGQAGLELPTSGDSPTLASHSAAITGVSHHTLLNLHVSLLEFWRFLFHSLILKLSEIRVQDYLLDSFPLLLLDYSWLQMLLEKTLKQ